MEQEEEKSKSDKTEEPTEEKINRAREEGHLANPREIMAAAVIIIITCYFYFYAPKIVPAFKLSFQNAWLNVSPQALDKDGLWSIIYLIAKPVLPFFLLLFLSLCIFPVLLGLLFTKFNWSWKKIEFNFDKLNPFKGIGRIFSLQTGVELLKIFIKFSILVVVAYFVMKTEIANSAKDYFYHHNIFASELSKSIFHLMFYISIAAIIIGISDYGYNYWKLRSDLKMTKQEIKEEFKRHEGDPLVKSQRRRFSRDLIFRKSLKEVPKASFIVTNPDHYSVAVRYVKGMKAPIVVAKGVDAFAFKIREVAKKHDIMIVENKPLARGLYAQVKIGAEVPSVFYAPIIEIMKYIYRIRGKYYFEKII